MKQKLFIILIIYYFFHVSVYSTDAVDRGWIVRFVRCSPGESHRPLPGRFPAGEVCIDSSSAFLRELFPAMSGVKRLLVIDQIEYASDDLAAIAVGLSRSPSAGLTLLILEVMFKCRLVKGI